jgi:DeoR/GlpR family transcriptional regulator of sugar metabolism
LQSTATGAAKRAARMNARHDRIIDFIAARGEGSVPQMARKFGMSVMTIRRDLMLLEQAGRLTRTHGGAVLSKHGIVEFAFAEKGRQFGEEKRAIALAVAAQVQPGMAVSLDSGTTTLEVAKALTAITPLTVLTSSLAIASVLYAHESLELVLLGGTVRKGSPDLTGWLTEENLKQFHVDLAIVGADGVSRDGAFTSSVNLTRVCQAVMAGAERTILAVDHSKFQRASFTRFAALRDFECVVTDAGTPAPTRKWLSAAAKRVVYTKA